MNGRPLRHQGGFTIIELLIVLIIISLLITAASVYFESARINSINGKRLGDVLQISGAVDNYAAANGGQYPDIPGGSGCADQITGLNPTNTTNFPGHKIPTDPDPETSPTTPCSNYKNGYIYQVNRSTYSNDATTEKFNYLLQVGLQGNIDPAQGNSFAACKNPPQDTARTCYQLNGPYCDANCPQ